MEPPDDDEPTFLRDLIKATRQRPVLVRWTDRDGSDRHTALTGVQASRLNAIAHGLRISPGEVLRRAAQIPVVKPGKAPAPEVAGAAANRDSVRVGISQGTLASP